VTKFRNYDLPGFSPVLAWNPIVMRCPGCELAKPDANGWIPCWHIRMCNRMMHNPTIPAEHREIYAGRARMRIHPKHADEPLGVRKPRVIAAQFMGDLGQATPECRADVLCLMELTPWHKYLVLTKWPEKVTESVPDNCYLGTTGTDQAMAALRLSNLVKCNARNLWFSGEPMLGPMSLSAYLSRLSFVACGPETGTGARPFRFLWMDDLERQVIAAGIPFYSKCDEDPGCLREWPEEWKAVTA